VSARREAAYRLASDALAVLHPEEWTRLYSAALEASGAAEPPLERPCACGGTVRRRNPKGRWPLRCETCKDAAGTAREAS
jgi:hypothetical protein